MAVQGTAVRCTMNELTDCGLSRPLLRAGKCLVWETAEQTVVFEAVAQRIYVLHILRPVADCFLSLG